MLPATDWVIFSRSKLLLLKLKQNSLAFDSFIQKPALSLLGSSSLYIFKREYFTSFLLYHGRAGLHVWEQQKQKVTVLTRERNLTDKCWEKIWNSSPECRTSRSSQELLSWGGFSPKPLRWRCQAPTDQCCDEGSTALSTRVPQPQLRSQQRIWLCLHTARLQCVQASSSFTVQVIMFAARVSHACATSTQKHQHFCWVNELPALHSFSITHWLLLTLKFDFLMWQSIFISCTRYVSIKIG